MNIVIPTADYPPIEGGIASVALHVSRELAALGHDVTVIAPYFPDTAAFDANEPVRVLRFRGYNLGPLRFFPLAAASIGPVRNADLILAINVSYGGVLGLLARKRYVVFAYAYEFLKFQNNPIAAALLRRVYGGAASVVAISKYTRDQLIDFGVSPSRVSVIYAGAPPVRAFPESAVAQLRGRLALDGHRVILAVGRFIRRKGHLTLVRAMARVVERAPDAKLVLAGRGPLWEEVSTLVRELHLERHVCLPGYLPDDEIAMLYHLCDVFALPNGQDESGHVEGFGLVFAEAHSYGKPVVAGRSGGAAEAVLDGETGLLVEPDQPEALAEAILFLLENPERARQFGVAGRARVEAELNWTHFTARVLETLERRP
ncbi:MAG: glycosyltransferase family 4 protein [Candidatus Hydrogenedentes bacterium]|nr:glycosyltransferase family 4 protein [Candidatus Hydrogenedentota bacterium]